MSGLDNYWALLNSKFPNAVDGPIGILFVHEVAYFGAFLPFWLADYIPSLQKYKIQKTEANDGSKMWKCFSYLMFLHFAIEFPLMCIAHPLMHFLGIKNTLPLPAWGVVAWQCLACFIIEDFYFYWIHRFLHWNAIYKYIHKVHHHHAAPFGIAAEYAHPVETVFLGLGSILGPFLLSFTHGMHLFTLYAWLAVRLMQTIEVHSGYNFPFSFNNWIPFWGGAEFHDFHHMTFSSNYASTFTIWDNVFGTAKPFYQWRDKQQQSVSSKKEQ